MDLIGIIIVWGMTGLTMIIMSLIMKERPPLAVDIYVWIVGFILLFSAYAIGG